MRAMRDSLLCACACLILIAASPAALADARTTVFLEELTSPELGERIRAGTTIVLIPIGGTEQNGPHIVLGKHNVRARALAEKIARALGNAVVAPVMAYVPEPAGHLRHPGTIAVPADAYRKVLAAAARSLKSAGFRDIVFLGDHGGYQQDLVRAAERLNRRFAGRGPRAHALTEYYRSSTDGFAALLRAQGFADAVIGRHAGLADTSLMLALDPALVRSGHLADHDRPGVDGDPARATAALGQPGVDLIVTRSAHAIRNAVARDRSSAQ